MGEGFNMKKNFLLLMTKNNVDAILMQNYPILWKNLKFTDFKRKNFHIQLNMSYMVYSLKLEM